MKYIKFNEDFLLLPLSFKEAEEVKNSSWDSMLNFTCGKFTKKDALILIPDARKRLNIRDSYVQSRCIFIVGAGTYKELLTLRNVPYTEIPRDWKVFKNYNPNLNGGRNFRGLAKVSDKIDILDLTWKNIAVKSVQSAIDALGDIEACIVVSATKFKENGNSI